LSVLTQAGLPLAEALAAEWRYGEVSLAADTVAGASRFAAGAGRHGRFDGR
jgi:enoyl-CoA hydratase